MCDQKKQIVKEESVLNKHSETKEKLDSTKIILTTLDWQPYIGRDLPNYGYVYQIVKYAFEKKGYKVEIRFLPWARTMNLALNGEADGYFPEYYNSELEKDFYFSDPFPGGPVGFYAREDIQYKFQTEYNMKNFYALTPFKIGIVRGYTNTKYFDEANYLNKDETTDDLSNLKKLYYNRVQLIFIDPNVAKYLIQSYLIQRYPDYNEKTYFMRPELEYKPLYVCINKKVKNAQKKINDFNEMLSYLKKEGLLKQILKNANFDEKGNWNP